MGVRRLPAKSAIVSMYDVHPIVNTKSPMSWLRFGVSEIGTYWQTTQGLYPYSDQ